MLLVADTPAGDVGETISEGSTTCTAHRFRAAHATEMPGTGAQSGGHQPQLVDEGAPSRRYDPKRA